MTELHPLDWGFMELEDTDRHISLGIGAVAIVAGPAPTRAEFVAWLQKRIDHVELLRRRVRRKPLNLSAPVWERDPDFDLAHHIRWTAVPGPHDESALRELVATELEQRLDRDHPLWQCVVVEQLTGDRWALIVKAHHSMVDGMSGIALFEQHLPVEFTDPVERLNAVHERVARHRARGEAEAEKSTLEVAELLPFAVGAWAFRLAGHFPQRSVGALATNVPGPRRRLSLDGRAVAEIWPCIPLAMRLRTTIAILSYGDNLVFGITGDYDSTPDIDLIAAGIEDGVAELLARAR